MNKKNILNLNSEEVKISDAPMPVEILLPILDFNPGQDKLLVKKGDSVLTGDTIFPGTYSTVTGTVGDIETIALEDNTFPALRITPAEKEEMCAEIESDPEFLQKEPDQLLSKLNRANLGFQNKLENIKTVVISAIDSDPGMAVNQHILQASQAELLEGAQLLRHLTGAQQIILILPSSATGISAGLQQAVNEVVLIKPVYPNGLPELIIKNLERKYDVSNHLYINAEKCVAALLALKEGRPFITKIVTVTGKSDILNYRVRIGTLLTDLLEKDINDGDKIILGSPMRGIACYHSNLPITAKTDAVFIQDRTKVTHYRNNQCMSCGKCVRVCPVNLDVNLICRFSEFSLFEQCTDLHINDCFECGLCAYHCPSGRSLVQFIQLAKKEIQKMEGEKT